MSSIAKFITNNAKYVILFWIILVLCLAPFRLFLNDLIVPMTFSGDENLESNRGRTLLEEQFERSFNVASHSIVFHSDGALNMRSDPRVTALTMAVATDLNQSLHPLDYDFPIFPAVLPAFVANQFVSADNATLLMQLSSEERSQEAAREEDVQTIREVLDGHLSQLTTYGFSTSEADQIEILLTGSPASNHDSLESAAESFEESEVVSIILIVLILFIVFGSLLGLATPILALLSSMAGIFGFMFFLDFAGAMEVYDVVPNIVNMIVIAIAVDYNLLSVVRFREEMKKRRGVDDTVLQAKDHAREAAAITIDTAGKAVVFSGLTVAVGFGTLLVLQNELATSMALSIMVSVVFCILTATTLTPAILTLVGRFINSPVKVTNVVDRIKRFGREDTGDEGSLWAKTTQFVTRYPYVFVVLGIVLLGPFALLSADMELGMDTVRMLPQETEARKGYQLIEEKFNLGTIFPIQVVVDTNTPNGIFDPALINAIGNLTSWTKDYQVGTEEQFTSITSFASFTNTSAPTRESQFVSYSSAEVQFMLSPTMTVGPGTTVPNPAHSYYVSMLFSKYVNYQTGDEDNSTALIELTTNLSPGSAEAWDVISDLRESLDDYFGPVSVGGENVDYSVSGQAASLLDTNNSLYADLPLMVVLAIVVIFLALVLLTRSILIPIEAIVTISTSILFSMGVMVFVFQQGNFVELIGGEQISIIFFIPLFLFTTILGLGMDYSIFLVSRIDEEYRKTHDNEQAIINGVAKTSGVITSAASIMVVTFLVFALSDIQILKMMGLAMAIAIFVDATFVRTIFLPALLKIGGSKNWWLPKWLDDRLPHIGLEH